MGNAPRGALATALLLLGLTSAFSQQGAQQITAIVNACVETARAYEVEQGVAQPHFDAYYNPATGRVQNVTTEFQPALFVFKKCMAQYGLPIDRKE
jgi:hypothetical protein